MAKVSTVGVITDIALLFETAILSVVFLIDCIICQNVNSLFIALGILTLYGLKKRFVK